MVEVGVVGVAEAQVVPGAEAAVPRGRVEQAQPVGEALPVVQQERGAGRGVVALGGNSTVLKNPGPKLGQLLGHYFEPTVQPVLYRVVQKVSARLHELTTMLGVV